MSLWHFIMFICVHILCNRPLYLARIWNNFLWELPLFCGVTRYIWVQDTLPHRCCQDQQDQLGNNSLLLSPQQGVSTALSRELKVWEREPPQVLLKTVTSSLQTRYGRIRSTHCHFSGSKHIARINKYLLNMHCIADFMVGSEGPTWGKQNHLLASQALIIMGKEQITNPINK